MMSSPAFLTPPQRVQAEQAALARRNATLQCTVSARAAKHDTAPRLQARSDLLQAKHRVGCRCRNR